MIEMPCNMQGIFVLLYVRYKPTQYIMAKATNTIIAYSPS